MSSQVRTDKADCCVQQTKPNSNSAFITLHREKTTLAMHHNTHNAILLSHSPMIRPGGSRNPTLTGQMPSEPGSHRGIFQGLCHEVVNRATFLTIKTPSSRDSSGKTQRGQSVTKYYHNGWSTSVLILIAPMY